MERNEFLKSLGVGMAWVCAGTCLQACGGSKSNNPTPDPDPVGGGGTSVNVDLSNRLANVGDQFSSSGVLFIRTAEGNTAASFVATEAVCPHQGGDLLWLKSQNMIQCQLHFAEYKSDGTVIQGPQNTSGNTRKLKIYPVTVNGSTLTAAIA
ncbi:MAG: Rieske (2Fe-2S) protein [Mucilaginibacter polytrichastri]|nr:Rieske (2Fe-2S) protein [Mucilaginibacter polytrichastri]